MEMLKTKFSSYCLNGLPKGCKLCVKGEKLVLFITGKCSRNCYYCSLSSKRKNKITKVEEYPTYDAMEVKREEM